MPLTIYRRHTEKCPYYGKHRNARNNRACPRRCPIYVQGSLGGEYVRLSLDLTYWEPPAELVNSWEKSGRVERSQCVAQARGTLTAEVSGRAAPRLPSATQPQASPLPEDPTTISIPGAIARFRASLTSQNLAFETLRKYRTLLTRLENWCVHERLLVVSELSVTRMDDFRGTWKDGPNYATKNLERLRAFAYRKTVRLVPDPRAETPTPSAWPTLRYVYLPDGQLLNQLILATGCARMADSGKNLSLWPMLSSVHEHAQTTGRGLYAATPATQGSARLILLARGPLAQSFSPSSRSFCISPVDR